MATTSILTGARQAAKKLPRTVQEVPALYGFSETSKSNLPCLWPNERASPNSPIYLNSAISSIINQGRTQGGGWG